MSAIAAIRRRTADQCGAILILVLILVLVGTLLGLAAVGFALNAAQSGVHDQRIRSAQQAAGAGVQQQLLLQSGSYELGYNLSGGPLGIGTLLNCAVQITSSTGVVIGSTQLSVGYNGACPSTSSGGNTGTVPAWQSLSNQDYYEAELCPNAQVQTTGGSPVGVCKGNTSSGGQIAEFPEIVSLGCHSATISSSSYTNNCSNNSGANQYARELVVLRPTGPLAAVEGENDVRINSTNVTNILNNTLPAALGCSSGLLGQLLCLVNGLLETVSSAEAPITSLTNDLSTAIVNGNISASNNLYLPANTVDINTNSNGGLGTPGGLLNKIAAIPSALQGLSATFEYGGQVCSTASGSCSTPPSQAATVNAIGATFVHASGSCRAGSPSTSCVVPRGSFTYTGSLTSAATMTSDTTFATCSGCTLVGGDLTVPSGQTLKFGPGTYAFCSVYAPGSAAITSGTVSGDANTTGGVQIYVLAPTSSSCTTSPTTPGYLKPGNFVACSGVSNALNGGAVNSVTGALAPSGFQIYLAGQSTKPGTTDTAITSCPDISESDYSTPSGDPTAQVYLGDPAGSSSAPATESAIVYAPSSEVTVNTTLAFVGSAIGWNVNLTALSVEQDLDIGNYPLSPVVTSLQPAETVQCDGSVVPLTGTSADLGGC